MGFFGDLVLARSDSPLLDTLMFGTGFTCAEGHPDCAQVCQPRERGWQIVQVHHGLPENSNGRWLPGLVAATGSPVMIASVMDSDVCEVHGLTPSGSYLSACLDPAMAGEFGLETPDVATSIERLAAWATEAQCTADRSSLRDVLTKRADPFVEDLFFELIEACGLSAANVPDEMSDLPHGGEAAVSGAAQAAAHPGHQPTHGCPRGVALEITILNLRRGEHLVLECSADPNCYAQVWLRPDGSYQLEYRDRSPAEHYQTRTVSAEKVITALTGWTSGEVEWREAFEWNPIGSWFVDSAES